jgi:hypothetical protein
MKTRLNILAFTSLLCLLAAPALGADDSINGKWKGQFDSQIGLQKYTFDFKVDKDNKLTGKAVGESDMGTNEVQIVEGKVNKDEVSFVEPLKFDDNEIRIEYTGKISGDEIKFHRKVGEFAEEDFVAKRVTSPDAKAPAAVTNAPVAK